MGSSKDNARRHRRQTVRILVDYQSEQGTGCDYATPLGAGGLFIECDEPLRKGAHVKLRFRLPHSDDLHEFEGRVSWVRDGVTGDRTLAPGMGVQFSDPTATGSLARELDHLD